MLRQAPRTVLQLDSIKSEVAVMSLNCVDSSSAAATQGRLHPVDNAPTEHPALKAIFANNARDVVMADLGKLTAVVTRTRKKNSERK